MAQNYPPAGPVYRGAPPPDSVYDYDDDDDQGMYRPLPPGQRLPPDPRYRAYPDERRVAAAAPNSARRSRPGSRQYDTRQAAPPAQSDPNVLRPPAPIGSAPNAAPQPVPPAAAAALPPEDQPEVGAPKELPANLKKQLVDYATREPAGTLIIDTREHLSLSRARQRQGDALRHRRRPRRLHLGRRRAHLAMKEWPDWFPPAEMIERQPYLPRLMAGGRGNPLGARALYLGKTLYRIHGTNQPSTIGTFVSSGCIRLINEDIQDLYSRVQVGTRVVVLPGGKPPAATAPPTPCGACTADRCAARRVDNAAVNAAPLPPIR